MYLFLAVLNRFSERPPKSYVKKKHKNYYLKFICYILHDATKMIYLMSIGCKTKTPVLTKAKFINESTDLNQKL